MTTFFHLVTGVCQSLNELGMVSVTKKWSGQNRTSRTACYGPAGGVGVVGESDHQTSNGEYDEDTSGFEDDRLSQSNEMDNYRIILIVMEILSMIKKTVEQVAIISLMEVVTFRLQNWKVNLTSPWRKNFFTHDALTKVMMFLMKNMCSG